MTFLLGLTGSIGMGKSTTAAMFAEEGVPVWDADATVHNLYARGGAAVNPIGELIPKAIIADAVSREVLKAEIAKNPERLKQIEAIVHPLVQKDREQFINKNNGLLLFDIPLLFETGADAWLDAVVVVTAPADVQKERVLSRPGMSVDQFQMILSRQVPDAEKRARADYVIETISLEAARKSVQTLIGQLKGSI